MEPTVKITLKEYEQLKNGFDSSELKKELEKADELQRTELQEFGKFHQDTVDCLNIELEKKTQEIKKMLAADFVDVTFDLSFSRVLIDRPITSEKAQVYFRKDKTPLWIKRLFNGL